jgi:hypothetical protein
MYWLFQRPVSRVGRRAMKKHRSFRGIYAVWLGGTGRDTLRYGVLQPER